MNDLAAIRPDELVAIGPAPAPRVKEITVISGKGGTGKTSLVASFAALAGNAVLADCDVDAADLHLLLDPRVVRREPFSGGKRARVNWAQCTACGKCKLHDLERVAVLTRHFGVPAMVCINKWDLNPELCTRIEAQARKHGLHPAGRVRYDRAVTEAQVQRMTTVEYRQDGSAADICQVWEQVKAKLTEDGKI